MHESEEESVCTSLYRESEFVCVCVFEERGGSEEPLRGI